MTNKFKKIKLRRRYKVEKSWKLNYKYHEYVEYKLLYHCAYIKYIRGLFDLKQANYTILW